MLTHEKRVAEFSRLRDLGVAGVKIDFFGGDGQSVIAYYQDILEDAAAYGLLVNFHGATLPRGWERTYPNLMTMEAVRGLEYVTFGQDNADAEPSHAAMLPFTRNVFDPMDFTPMVLDRINRIERRTSSAFELALSVLFTSGIQHYAEIPEGMAKAPAYVRDFLRTVPSSRKAKPACMASTMPAPSSRKRVSELVLRLSMVIACRVSKLCKNKQESGQPYPIWGIDEPIRCAPGIFRRNSIERAARRPHHGANAPAW